MTDFTLEHLKPKWMHITGNVNFKHLRAKSLLLHKAIRWLPKPCSYIEEFWTMETGKSFSLLLQDNTSWSDSQSSKFKKQFDQQLARTTERELCTDRAPSAGKLMRLSLNQTADNFSTEHSGFRENNQTQRIKRKQNSVSSPLVYYFRSQHKQF